MPRTDRSGFDRRREMKEAGASGEEIMDETFEFTMKAFSPESLKERPAGVQRVKELLAAHYSLPIEEMSIPSRARADIGLRARRYPMPDSYPGRRLRPTHSRRRI